MKVELRKQQRVKEAREGERDEKVDMLSITNQVV